MADDEGYDAVQLEWNPKKAAANARKHRVKFDEAMTVFADVRAITAYDPDHSDDEHRFLTIGISVDGCVLFVSHTNRGDSIRIISARRADKQEREEYLDGNR
jgi:uncharacterized DUF497 family protein